MPTLGEVCSRLRVSRRTLDKWLERLHIEPERHPYDFRYFTLTDEQVEAIKEARAHMPGVVAPLYRPAALPPSVTHRPSADVWSDTPQRSDLALNANLGQQRQPRRPSGEKKPLPDGWVELPAGWAPVSDYAKEHGVWKYGRSLLEGRAAPYERAPKGQPWARWSASVSRWYPIESAYTPAQQAQVAAYAREHEAWRDLWHN